MYSKPGCQNVVARITCQNQFFLKMLARKDLRVFNNTPGVWKVLKIMVEASVSCSLGHTKWLGLRLRTQEST